MTTPFRNTMKLTDFTSQFENKIDNFQRIARNTFRYTIGKVTKIRLYETDIIIYTGDSIILNSGGFYNNLTKNRINEALYHGHIYQKTGIWYYEKYCTDYNEGSTRFFDGIEISDTTGEVMNPGAAPKFIDIDKENKKINKLIAEYCKAIDKLDKLPDDYMGDCFYCQFDFNNKIDHTEHLLSHLEEKYIMKSLILTALRNKGYNNPSFIYEMDKTSKKKTSVTSAVRQYFRKHLIKKG